MPSLPGQPAEQVTAPAGREPEGALQAAETIRRFFADLAPRYDRANHLLSGGLDWRWRSKIAMTVRALSPRRVLDLATGSGDLALLLQKTCPNAMVAALDFCPAMLERAKRKGVQRLIAGDALRLPFDSGSFDAATVAFGLRNMASWGGALREMARVLAGGGHLVILEFSRPRGALGVAYRAYLHWVLPRLARLITGHKAAYDYLGDSITAFPDGAAMQELLHRSGFITKAEKRLNGGIVTMYVAQKAKGSGRQPPYPVASAAGKLCKNVT